MSITAPDPTDSDIPDHDPGRPPRPRMTPSQLHTFDELLAVGGQRPVSPPGAVEELRDRIANGTRAALSRWTERNLWLGKSPIERILTCEAQVVAERAEPRSAGMHPAVAIGNVTHRAIQISHTHPGLTVAEYVRSAIQGARREDEFSRFWDDADESAQSDVIVAATSKVTNWLDSWPELMASWTPRFEESIQARVGGLTLSARPDLVLGRPRADGRQTMLIADLKSVGIGDHHLDEAHFYALVAALRHGCLPYRSVVYSLPGGDWTEPDITAQVLRRAADRVIRAANATVEVLTAERAARFGPGRHCGWCVAHDTCDARVAWDDAGRPEDFEVPVEIGQTMPRPDVVAATGATPEGRLPGATAHTVVAPVPEPLPVVSSVPTVAAPVAVPDAPVSVGAPPVVDDDEYDPYALD